jgi:putative tryptophan/tyrosine transport system substrate-binding protein
MKRREFIAGLSGAAAWPVVALAQKSGRVYRLGILTVGPDRTWDEFLQGLRSLGYIEGQNLIVDWRYSEGQAERWPDLANELVRLKVDVIVANTTPAAVAAKQATSIIPIVIPTAFDPVGTGLADSLARPGGNVTGIGLFMPEVSAKSLALLKEAVPLTKVAVLWNPDNQANAIVLKEVETTARALGLKLNSKPVREPKDLDGAFLSITQEQTDGLLVLTDAFFLQYRSQIAEFTIRNKLPAAFPFREWTQLGGLMSYGPNRAHMYREGADYVDKILKGAKPADLPIEQPTEFEFVLNLKTARRFGLDISPGLVARADEVIE